MGEGVLRRYPILQDRVKFKMCTSLLNINLVNDRRLYLMKHNANMR